VPENLMARLRQENRKPSRRTTGTAGFQLVRRWYCTSGWRSICSPSQLAAYDVSW